MRFTICAAPLKNSCWFSAARALFILLLLCFPMAASAQGFNLGLRIDLPVGSGAIAVATGDLNGDSFPDLAVANQNDGTVSVIFGNGVGGFSTKSDYQVGSTPASVAIANVNNDKWPDLIVANAGSATVSLLLGSGGGFAAAAEVVTGPVPASAAAGDLNGDGNADLVVANHGSGNVSVFMGNGSGGFSGRVDYATGAGAYSVAIGDLNRDAILDVAVANNGANTISVMLGTGTGAFAPKADYATGSGPMALTLGDLNGDLMLDMAVANSTANTVSVLLAKPTGGFWPRSNLTVGTRPYSVAIGDVTGDALPDLVAANWTSSSVSVIVGNGGGVLFGPKSEYSVGTNPASVALCDLDNDGKLDIAVSSLGLGVLSVLLGSGGLVTSFATAAPAGADPRSIVCGDLNSDGFADLACANYNSWNVSVALTNGVGAFSTTSNFNIADRPQDLAIGDIDGDGSLDLAAVGGDPSGRVSLMFGDGQGGLSAPSSISVGSYPRAIALGDLNGDGIQDIAVANNGDNTVSVILGGGARVFLPRVDFPGVNSPWSVDIGDINNDGNLDLVVTSYNNGSIVLMLGDGTGGLAVEAEYSVGTNPWCVDLGDLNGDGWLDAVTANTNSGSISVLLGDGTGSLLPSVNYPLSNNPSSVSLGDVSGDGRPDVLVTGFAGTSIALMRGDGRGGLGPASYASTGRSGASSGRVADFNGDGRMDIAATYPAGGQYVTSVINVWIAQVATRISVAASPAVSVDGMSIVLTASLDSEILAGGPPYGEVRFFDGTSPLGSTWISGGMPDPATFTIATPRIGFHSFSAQYLGYGSYAGSSSMPQNCVVLSAAPPKITSVRDVAHDQGGQIKIAWLASVADAAPGLGVSEYLVWRAVPPNAAAKAIENGAVVLKAADVDIRKEPGLRYFIAEPGGTQTTYWEYLGSSPAVGDPGYSCVIPTTSDSLPNANPKTLVRVQARSAATNVFWSSAPDSGYSVDNLAPVAPGFLTGRFAGTSTTLHWGRNTEADLSGYRVYRGDFEDFTPTPANLVVAKPDTGYVDHVVGSHYYKVCAVDIHGNLSPFLQLTPDATSPVPEAGVAGLRLYPCQPNPFNPRTTLKFELPFSGRVRLAVFDLGGRLVQLLVDEDMAQGAHEVVWSGTDALGRNVGSGTYLARLEFDGKMESVRMGLVR